MTRPFRNFIFIFIFMASGVFGLLQAQTILTDVAKRKLDPYDAVEKLTIEILGSNKRSSKHVTTSTRRQTPKRRKTRR